MPPQLLVEKVAAVVQLRRARQEVGRLEGVLRGRPARAALVPSRRVPVQYVADGVDPVRVGGLGGQVLVDEDLASLREGVIRPVVAEVHGRAAARHARVRVEWSLGVFGARFIVVVCIRTLPGVFGPGHYGGRVVRPAVICDRAVSPALRPHDDRLYQV